jgi:hypothetical protein
LPLVRCPTHGRVYDSDQERACPLCLAEGPHRRPLAQVQKGAESPEEAAKRGRMMLLVLLLVVTAGAAGAYFYLTSNTAEKRAQAVRDSLRAVAAGPPRPDTSRFAKATDFSPIRRARALKATLDGLVRSNRATLLGMTAGPIDTTATNRAARNRARQYAAFARRWHAALDAATRGGTEFRYEPGVQYSLQMDQVTNSLGAAVAVLNDMVPRDSVKARTTRQADLTAARGYLSNAGTVLTNLPTTAPSRTSVRRRSTRR